MCGRFTQTYAWLDPATPVPDAKALLKDHRDRDLVFHRVDRRVNASSYTGADADAPLEQLLISL